MKPIYFITLLAVMLFTYGCNSEETNFKDYYFQMDEFTETMVYKFECSEIGLVEYWEMTFFPESNSFYTKSYNEELEETYFIKEEITNEGAKAIGFGRSNPFSPGGSMITKDKVLQTDVYLWEHEGPYSYQVEFNSNGEDHQTLERERTFVGFVTITVNDKSYEALKFKDKFTLKNLDADKNNSYVNYSYYALGMGCIKIEMDDNQGEYHNFELTKVLDGAEWAQLLSKKEF